MIAVNILNVDVEKLTNISLLPIKKIATEENFLEDGNAGITIKIPNKDDTWRYENWKVSIW